MKTKQTVLIFILLLSSASALFAQGLGDIEIFGFYQARFSSVESAYSIKGSPVPGMPEMTFVGKDIEYKSPYVQQLNLMLRREFTPSVSTFINFEIINNFSTENDWGAFNLEEVWLNYEYAPSHSIKGGLLVPKFNNLNEIKNRMPLLPYIMRPMIYEPTYRTLVAISDFIPERAFVQLQGSFYMDDVDLNYSAFVGPSESDYVVSTLVGATVPGTDTTNFLSFGGRLGINYNDLRVGVSASFDKDNQQATYQEDISRTRLGVDFGYSLYGFTFDGELINVTLDPKNTDKDLDKLAYYGTLSYDFTDQIFAYGCYGNIQDNASDFLEDGLNTVLVGGGYRASSNIVLKLQYYTAYLDGEMPLVINPNLPPITAKTNIDAKYYSLAISVVF